ncbi:MAG: POTRA domain-containing protein [Croceivirga sp.]
MKKGMLALCLLSFSLVMTQEREILSIEFKGLKKTKEQFLRRLLKTKPETTFDAVRIQKDLERLNRLPGIANAKDSLVFKKDGVTVFYLLEENFTIIPGLRIATANDGSFAYRLSAFEFNFLGNNQLVGGYYERNVFDSYGAFWEHPFLFSDKAGLGFNYQNVTRQEPIFFEEGTKDYRFNSRQIEGQLILSPNFNNEIELGALLVKERYTFEGEDPVPGAPLELEANKIFYRAVYRYIDFNIDYQYFDGFQSEFTGQYIQQLNGDAPGQEFLGNFLSLRNDFIYYKKLGRGGNWGNRLRLAAAIGNEDSPFAPFTLDNQLNIRGVGNLVDRGSGAIVLNTEYRHTLYEKGWFVVQSNVFLDAGAWRDPGKPFSQLFDGSNTRVYPGAGFRLIHKRIFNAVFRLDYGFGIGTNATNGIVFGIGQYF